MEIERNVKIQIVGDPDGNLKAGFSSGPHAGRRLPSYSQAERRVNLGPKMIDRIRSAFAPAAKAQEQPAAAKVPTHHRNRPFSLRNGW